MNRDILTVFGFARGLPGDPETQWDYKSCRLTRGFTQGLDRPTMGWTPRCVADPRPSLGRVVVVRDIHSSGFGFCANMTVKDLRAREPHKTRFAAYDFLRAAV